MTGMMDEGSILEEDEVECFRFEINQTSLDLILWRLRSSLSLLLYQFYFENK